MKTIVDSVFNTGAPQPKPAPSSSPRECGGEFESYLREATQVSTAEKSKPKKSPTPSQPIDSQDTSISNNNETADNSTLPDRDESQPLLVEQPGDSKSDQTVETAPQDEVILSLTAGSLISVTAEPQAIVETTDEQPLASTLPVALTGKQVEKPAATSSAILQIDTAVNRETEVKSTEAAQLEPTPVTETVDSESDAVLPIQSARLQQESATVANLPLSDEPNPPTTVVDQAAPTTPVRPEPSSLPSTTVSSEVPEDKQPTSEQIKPSEVDKKETIHASVEVPVLIDEIATESSSSEPSERDRATPINSVPTSSRAESAAPVTNHQAPPVTETLPDTPASPTENSDRMPAVDRVRFIQRVANAFRSAQQDDGHIQLRLSPPELGSLRIEIAVRNGVLTANLETETADARRVLLDNLPALRQRLAEQDIRVEKFDVDVRRDGGQQDNQANARDQQAQQQAGRVLSQNRLQTVPSNEGIISRVPLGVIPSSDRGLDVRI